MSIQDQLHQDYLTAFKGHDQKTVDALRLMKAAVKNAEIELRHEPLTDPEVIIVLTREAKRRKESITVYQQGKRDDLAAIEALELTVIEKYLPAQISDSDLESAVQAVIDDLKPTAKDFGKVMSAVMAKVKGQADGNRVSAAVKQHLK